MTAVVRYLAAAVAVVAAAYCLVLARAEMLFHRDTEASVAAAVRLVPYNSAYVARLAAWQPENKLALLRRALKLNPWDAESAIQLGLAAEMEQRDAASAKRYFLQAARVDHMFLPKWTLTNFYFRRQNPTKFFRWAKAALETTPYPADPVFTQMWLISNDSEQIARAIPDRPSILLQYAAFLANKSQYAAIPQAIKRLVALTGTRDPADFGLYDQIGPLEDRLLAAGEVEPALEVWRTLVRARWVSGPAPSPERPIGNGDFRAPFFKHGFDWKPVDSPGVSIDQLPDEKSVRISFSGDEPENCRLLEEYLPLEPNRLYWLAWQADGPQLDRQSGLAWRMYPVSEQDQSSEISGDLLDRSHPACDFKSPGGNGLALLALEYHRPQGSTRITGTVTLSAVTALPH